MMPDRITSRGMDEPTEKGALMESETISCGNALRIATTRQVWDALRLLVPDLPLTTRRAVLWVCRTVAQLTWEEETRQAGDIYLAVHSYTWTGKPAVDDLWSALTAHVGIAPSRGWQEMRIELRDLDQPCTVVIEGRSLWIGEESVGAEEKLKQERYGMA